MNTPPPSPHSSTAPPSGPSRRHVRWFLPLLATLGVLLALPWVALQQLNRPWVKTRIQRLVRESAPYDVDYAQAQVRLFSGLELVGLSVRSAPDARGVRELEAEVQRLQVRWSLAALLAPGHRLDALTLEGPRIVLVRSDEAPPAPAEQATEPSPPLSQLAGQWLRAAPPVQHVALSSLSFQSKRLHAGATADAFTLEDVGLTLDAAPGEDGWSLRARAGTPQAPLLLRVQREGPEAGAARLHVWMQVDAEPSRAAVALDARVLEQNLVPDVHLEDALHLEATAHFEPGHSRTRLSVTSLRAADGSADLRAEVVLPDGAGPLEVPHGEADVDLSRLLRAAPPGLVPLTLKEGVVHLQARELALAGTELVRGTLSLDAEATALEVPQQGLSLGRGTLQLGVSPASSGMKGSGVLTVESLTLAGKRPLRIPRARVEVGAADAVIDRAHPERSSGRLEFQAALGTTRARAALSRQGDTARYTLDVQVPQLAELRPYVPARYANRVGWSSALSLRARGDVAKLESKRPTLRQDLVLEWQRPRWEDVGAQKLALTLHLDGDLSRGSVDADLRLEELQLQGHALGDSRLQASVKVDRPQRSVRLELKGTEGPQLSLSGAVSFQRARQALRVDLDGRLGSLGRLSPLLPLAGLEPLALETLDVALSVHGDVLGTVLDVKEDALVLAPDPLRTAAFAGVVEGKASGLQWKKAQGTELTADTLSLHADLGREPGRRTVRARFEAGHLRMARPHAVEVRGVKGNLELAAAGDLAEGVFDLTQQLRIESLSQDVAPSYPTGDLTLEASARRNASGVIRLTKLAFDNAAAGTHLELTGAVDWSDLRHRFSLEGELNQELAPLSGAPELFVGKGKVGLGMRVESPDMRLFRTKGTLRFERADLQLPRKGVEVESLEGQVPFVTDLLMKEGALSVVRRREVNAYSLLRFADQHPLQSTSGYLSAERITTPYMTLEPLAANLRIDQRVMSLSQLELGVRGGRVTGQCVLDWDGAASALQARVRATGVQSSHGEPFDGNVAIAVSMRERSIDGRADVLRIGNRHLLDLLDLQDPHHTDASINRMRNALSFGHPENMRVLFDGGFASVRINFGGLARFVSVDELHGIPLGPLLDRAMANAAKSLGKP